MDGEDRLGEPSHFTCPECHGALWEIREGRLQRYRCHVGHAFTARVLLEAQVKAVESALWSALRALQERADLLRRMAAEARERDRGTLTTMYEERADDYERDAALIRDILFHGAKPRPEDIAEILDAESDALAPDVSAGSDR